MSFIKSIEPGKAEGELAEIYQQIRSERGRVADIYTVHSLDPELLRLHRDFYFATMHRDIQVSAVERESMALAVSVANDCPYCTRHHAENLREAGGGEALILSLTLGERVTGECRRLSAVVYYARKLTLLPNSVSADDITELRRAGFSDLDILHIAQIICYYNYVNRLANALGVESKS